jgi:hypothetical protein
MNTYKTVSIDGIRDILIPNVPRIQQSIGSNAPHWAVLNHRLSEVQKDLGALGESIDGLRPPKSALDLLGGCGFSAALIHHRFPRCELILNDRDPLCAEVLRTNFPEDRVHQKDILSWDFPQADLIWIDFNNFTLKRWGMWGDVLLKAAVQSHDVLMWTDSACYGFRMGNLDAYGVRDPRGYYNLLNDQISPTGMMLDLVIVFGGAAIIRANRKSLQEPFEIRNAEHTIQVYEKRGFFA